MHGRDDVAGTGGARDEGGPSVDHPVPHLAGDVVRIVSGSHKRATEAGSEVGDPVVAEGVRADRDVML
jgi:hypothetical protein